MKIAITGASGEVGKLLVPILLNKGHDLLLVGRKAPSLEKHYSRCVYCDYSELKKHLTGKDILIHLAVLNNNAEGDYIDFHLANVDLTVEIANLCVEMQCKKFINVSSIHALDTKNNSDYAETKRQAALELAKITAISIETLYLPLVYGKNFVGRLAKLNSLPKYIAQPVFSIFSALRPTVHVDKIVDHITKSKDEIGPLTILSDGQKNNLTFQFVKRCLDLGFVLSVTFLFWWLFLLVWFAVRISSSGPALFAQHRIGKNGAVFTCYKFRTMYRGTVNAATNEVPFTAVTNVGKFLRRTKLDELPQIWNILCDQMSLVGPRPCLPVQIQLCEARTARGILAVKPGITGLAQIQGIDMSNIERIVSEDHKYIMLQGLQLELQIILKTFAGGGSGDRVSL